MDGFLTNNVVTEPEIKDSQDIKKPIVAPKIREPKPKKQTNVLRALLIGVLLFLLLAGSFLVFDKNQKGDLKLGNANLPFFKTKDKNNTLNDTNQPIIPDLNKQDTNIDTNTTS